ncbi:MAG: hypothetical protein HQK58_09090 [Deltaproteobacteria bacterium]|nr:hypothetical protein [Deltaproteobacteria bacterium]
MKNFFIFIALALLTALAIGPPVSYAQQTATPNFAEYGDTSLTGTTWTNFHPAGPGSKLLRRNSKKERSSFNQEVYMR